MGGGLVAAEVAELFAGPLGGATAVCGGEGGGERRGWVSVRCVLCLCWGGGF